MRAGLKAAARWRPHGAARLAVLIAGLLAVPTPAAWAQCAMCRRALLSPEGQQIVGAFRSGILFLLVAPFAVFATLAALAVRADRRRVRDAAAHQ